MSILEAISPTAREVLNQGEDQYQFDVTWRYTSGTNLARCHGCTASSTSDAKLAAEAAARKHWNRFLGTSGVNGSLYTLTVKPNGMGIFMATFKRKDVK